MKEFYTKALVLERKDVNEVDGLIYFFTEDLGRLVARAKSIRKIKSKLSGHLQPLNFIKIRFVKLAGPNDGFSVVDCLDDEEMSHYKTKERHDLLPIIAFLNKSAFDLQTDRRLWFFLRKIFEKKYRPGEIGRVLVKLLGFDSEGAECFSCGTKDISFFLGDDNVFLCSSCASKFPQDRILLIK